MKTIPIEVTNAFDAWLKADKWKSSMTRSEAGLIGARKRTLNKMLKKHSLTFDEVGQVLANLSAVREGGSK